MLCYIFTVQKSIALEVNFERSLQVILRSNKVSVQIMWIIIKFFHGRLIREIFFIKLFKKKIRSNCIFTPVMTQIVIQTIENFLILSSHNQSFQVYRSQVTGWNFQLRDHKVKIMIVVKDLIKLCCFHYTKANDVVVQRLFELEFFNASKLKKNMPFQGLF